MLKNYFVFISIILMIFSLQGQAPDGFHYQAVARDQSGQPITDQSIDLHIGIHRDSPEGEEVYAETFLVSTNEFGLINLTIGHGQALKGDFSDISWSESTYYVAVSMDIEGEGSYIPMGVSQLMSVPYALHALTAENVFSGNYEDLENAPDLSSYVSVETPQTGDILFFDDDSWYKLPIGEENQALLVKDGLPQWSSVSFGDTDLLPPTLEILFFNGINQSEANVNAEITDDGGAHISESGVVYSQDENPGFEDQTVYHTEPGVGAFTVELENLEPGTTYYVRAFATNGVGTSFSAQDSFTTWEESTDTTGTVTDVEGTVYQTILIENQWWMAENLTTRKYNDGSDIATGYTDEAWVELTTGAWAYFNDDHQWDPIYGKLYNWYAATDPRGICPEGWRLPTDQEIRDLRDAFGGTSEAGGKFKETGTAEDGDGYWREPNEGATNSSGFSARPGGARIHGAFVNRETAGYFWTSDEAIGEGYARNFLVVYDDASMWRHNYHKHYGLSIRCVMD